MTTLCIGRRTLELLAAGEAIQIGDVGLVAADDFPGDLKHRWRNKDAEDCLRDLLSAYDSGHLEMSSEEISRGCEEPHLFHEGWLYYARQALEGSKG